MSKIIFLDVDGVLNSHRWYEQVGGANGVLRLPPASYISQKKTHLLNAYLEALQSVTLEGFHRDRLLLGNHCVIDPPRTLEHIEDPVTWIRDHVLPREESRR